MTIRSQSILGTVTYDASRQQQQQHTTYHRNHTQFTQGQRPIRARSRTLSPDVVVSGENLRNSIRPNGKISSQRQYGVKEHQGWSHIHKVVRSRIRKGKPPNNFRSTMTTTTTSHLEEAVSNPGSQRGHLYTRPGDAIDICNEEETVGDLSETDTNMTRQIRAQQGRGGPTSRVGSTSVHVISDEDRGRDVDNSIPFSIIPKPLQQDDEIEITEWTERRPSRTAAGHDEIVSVVQNGVKCAPGKDIELNTGDFMRIQKLIQDSQGQKWMIGHLFMRHNDFRNPKWPRRSNEVVMMATVKQGRTIDVVKRPVQSAYKHRHLILTNETFPNMSRRTHPDSVPDLGRNRAIGPLFCRWKQTFVIDDTGKTIEESIERLPAPAADSESNACINDFQLRLDWRHGLLRPGGEHTSSRIHIEDEGPRHVNTQMYSFGDVFCGAGGASCGADLAGLHVKFGVDISKQAMTSYRLNFLQKGTECYHADVFDFIARFRGHKNRADVLHISPPCQPFSPAHTVPSLLRDEMNQAAIFAVESLLATVRPRVVTLEETYGLFNRHHDWFNALVKMFLDIGYSIRWTGARLEEYGLPQRRKRLLLIAAGPGEKLPPFPPTTHSAVDKNKKSLCTIEDAIGNIPRRSSITHHDLRTALFEHRQFKVPYSATTLAKTITTSGGVGNHHPSGKRSFTLRELAALQLFPLTYQFADCGVTELRRQIGNAVPPAIFKKIYREIIMSLRKTDGLS